MVKSFFLLLDTVEETAVAEIRENDEPTNQEIDELLLDTVEETAEAEIRQLDNSSEELIADLLKDDPEEPLLRATPSQEHPHLQQPQTSPTKIPTNGSGVTEPTTTSGTKPNTTTPLPSTNDDASNDTSSIEDNDKIMYVNIVFMEDSEEGQQEEENYPPPPKTPTPAEQTRCPP